MKKIFQDCMIAVIFTFVCSMIAAVMGLIEAHDKKKNGRRPFGPTKILVYTAEWIRKITKHTIGCFQHVFQSRREHAVKFEDDVIHRLSPEMMATIDNAPHYTMAELEGITAPVKEPIIITN